MLPDHEIQLLTAFVDGELTQRQRKAVMRLLERSSEARTLLKQLQENAHLLKKLPYQKVEPSLVTDVLQAIADQQVQVQPRIAPPRRRAWLPYVAGVIAATILIVVFEIVYWNTVNNNPVVPKGGLPNTAKTGQGKKDTPILNPGVTPLKKDNALLALAVAVTEGAARDAASYIAPKPYLVPFGDLAQKDSKASSEFAHRLNVAKSVHLEITVNNNDVAMMRLREVLRERQINLVTDPGVNKLLKANKPAAAEFLVYAENLTTEDVTKLMRELGHQYVVGQGTNQKMVNSPYMKLAVGPTEYEDKQQVAKLFGVDVSAIDLKNRKETKGDPKRQRQAVVLPATSGGAPSPEVRQFVNQRQAPQAGTLQVIIKIRQK